MIKLIATVLVAGLLLIGCATPDVSPTEETLPLIIPPEQKIEQPTEEQSQAEEPSVERPEEQTEIQPPYVLKATPARKGKTEVILPGQPPDDTNWISPGKVLVGNFYPGARAEWILMVHNGNDIATSFSIKYRHPDHVGEGYIKPPLEAQDWIIIADSTPVIAPRATKEILIVLEMPKDSATFAPRTLVGLKWEFWISVIDTSQTGMVRTELCLRWLVDMRM